MAVDTLKPKQVCAGCLGDPVISAKATEEGATGQCSYCGTADVPCLTLETLAPIVDEFYREYHTLGDEYPHFEAGSDKPLWEHHGQSPAEIVQDMLSADDMEIAEDIVAINSEAEAYDVAHDGTEPFFDDTLNYVERPIYDAYHSDRWLEFCETVKHQSRFFNVRAKEILREILDGLEALKTVDAVAPIREFGREGSGEAIYRGRRADARIETLKIALSPAAELGPPPKAKTPAGRMNPAGIPVLYGSLDRKTCLAELRAPIGGTVITGKFELLRPIRVLDLTVLSGAYRALSIFSDDFERRAGHLAFLRRFDAEIAKPVLPGDEILEYIPTQAFMEYLAEAHDERFEGVIFSSTQTGAEGKNIVLLPRSLAIARPPQSHDGKAFTEAQTDDTFMIFEGGWAGHDEERSPLHTHEESESEAFSDDPVVRYAEGSTQIHTITAIEHRFDMHEVEIINPADFEDAKFDDLVDFDEADL